MWAPWFVRQRRDARRRAELDAHLAHHVDDLIARGVAPDEARRQARVALGNLRSRREDLDDMQSLAVMETLWRDVRYALRMMRRSPGFAVTVIATLALVIGANTAVFSLANGLLFAPLPYPDAQQLYLLRADVRSPRGEFSGTAHDAFTWEAIAGTSWRDRATVFSGWSAGVNLAVDGQALFVDQQRVSAGHFRVLGTGPAMGREFLPKEDRPGGPAVVILSHGLWTRVFGGRPDVLGQTLTLRGEAWQVVGVMPEGFRGTADADVWTPLRPSTSGEGSGTNYSILVRVPAGVSLDAATAELRPALDPSLRHRGLRDDTTATVALTSLADEQAAGNRDIIVMLGAAAVVVLLIACANLATLLLARGGTRTREIATRMALGSGRLAVVRQLLVETMVLAGVGGAAGLLVGWLGLSGLQYLAGPQFSDWARVTIDTRVVLMCGGLSLLTSVLFGLGPAWQASRLDVQTAIIEGGTRSIASGGRHWTRRGLIVVEVALGVVLLVTAGLLTRTFINLASLDPGFRVQGLYTTQVSLLDARYPGPDEANQLFQRVLDQLGRAPNVEAATVSLGLPFQRVLNMGFRFDGAENAQTVSVMYVSPDFFRTFDIGATRGRVFGAADNAAAAPVLVVNDAFERFYSKDQPALARRVRVSGQMWDIVGVVASTQQRPGFSIAGMTPGPLVASPTIYLPAAQMTRGVAGAHLWFGPAFTVRASSREAAERALLSAIGAADPLLPAGPVESLADLRGAATGAERMLMTLVGLLAVVALVLTTIGLHGVIAHAVGERTREFGIRLALGASPGGTVRMMVVSGLTLAIVGVVAGLLLARPASTLVSASLYGITPDDPWTHVGAAGFLLLVTAAASLAPALRILRIDPGKTLRG